MVARFALVALISLALPAGARAQDTRSIDLAKQLTQILDQKKLDVIALSDTQNAGAFIAALYFPGTQLLVVSAKYSAPALLNELLLRKDYRGVYTELASASVPGSKVFVMDTYADGLVFKPSGTNAPDTVENGTKQTTFDGDWKKAKLSEADYAKTFADCDAAYVKALQSLITHLKTSGT
jgi:hypothetical protein